MVWARHVRAFTTVTVACLVAVVLLVCRGTCIAAALPVPDASAPPCHERGAVPTQDSECPSTCCCAFVSSKAAAAVYLAIAVMQATPPVAVQRVLSERWTRGPRIVVPGASSGARTRVHLRLGRLLI